MGRNILLVVLAGLLAFFVADWLRANARAAAALRSYRATQDAFVAFIESRAAQDTAAADTAADLSSIVDSLERAAEAAGRASEAAGDTISSHLPDSLLGVFARFRAATERQREALTAAIDSLRRVVELKDRQLALRAAQLQKYEARLAETVAALEASERARRPSALTWATRGLALYGAVRLVEGLVTAP